MDYRLLNDFVTLRKKSYKRKEKEAAAGIIYAGCSRLSNIAHNIATHEEIYSNEDGSLHDTNTAATL